MTDEARRTVSVWLSRGRDRVSDLRMRLELYGGEDLISTISSNANTNAITHRFGMCRDRLFSLCAGRERDLQRDQSPKEKRRIVRWRPDQSALTTVTTAAATATATATPLLYSSRMLEERGSEALDSSALLERVGRLITGVTI